MAENERTSPSESLLPAQTEIALFAFLGLFTAYFLVVTTRLEARVGLFPTIVLSGLLVLVLARVVQIYRSSGITTPALSVDGDPDGPDEDGGTSFGRILRLNGWPFVFFVAIYLFGMYNAIPLLMVSFLLVESDMPLSKVLLYSVLIYGAMYLLFELLLNLRPYTGVFL
jgi:hypothetical protein